MTTATVPAHILDKNVLRTFLEGLEIKTLLCPEAVRIQKAHLLDKVRTNVWYDAFCNQRRSLTMALAVIIAHVLLWAFIAVPFIYGVLQPVTTSYLWVMGILLGLSAILSSCALGTLCAFLTLPVLAWRECMITEYTGYLPPHVQTLATKIANADVQESVTLWIVYLGDGRPAGYLRADWHNHNSTAFQQYLKHWEEAP